MPVAQDPHREIDDRRRDGPDPDLAHEPPHEADRSHQREREADGAEDELPDPRCVETEHTVGERGSRRRDHRDLEHGPAEALEDVEHRCEVRAALTKRRALQRHRRNSRVCTDRGRDRQHRVSDQPADDRRQQRLLQRQAEVRRGHEDEQRHPEVRPEQQRVERTEDAEALRNGLDAPGWRVAHCSPFAGANRIRFDGCDLSPRAGTPVTAG